MTLTLGLFLAACICTAIAVFSATMADRPGDDFGAIVPAIIFSALAFLLFIVWIGRLVWGHFH